MGEMDAHFDMEWHLDDTIDWAALIENAAVVVTSIVFVDLVAIAWTTSPATAVALAAIGMAAAGVVWLRIRNPRKARKEKRRYDKEFKAIIRANGTHP